MYLDTVHLLEDIFSANPRRQSTEQVLQQQQESLQSLRQHLQEFVVHSGKVELLTVSAATSYLFCVLVLASPVMRMILAEPSDVWFWPPFHIHMYKCVFAFVHTCMHPYRHRKTCVRLKVKCGTLTMRFKPWIPVPACRYPPLKAHLGIFFC